MIGGLLHLLLLSHALATREEGGSFGDEEHPRRHRHHRHDVHLAGFFPTSSSRGHQMARIGQGVMPAVKLALRDVNRSPDILTNIHLRMHWNNTAVSRLSLVKLPKNCPSCRNNKELLFLYILFCF